MQKETKVRVAFSIYMDLVRYYEAAQYFYGWILGSSSGWSQEDLPSNTVGFYMALWGRNREQMSSILGRRLSPGQTNRLQKELGDDLGKIKNDTPEPVNHNDRVRELFPSLNWDNEMKFKGKFAQYIKELPQGKDYFRVVDRWGAPNQTFKP